MGFYRKHIVPRLIDLLCGVKAVHPVRARTCAGLHGEVLELGFGSGHNVPFYPPAVKRVSAVEPADVGWNMAEKRIEDSQVPIVRAGLDGQSLPFSDRSFDTALCTWTLCTIPDPDAALREVRRVLKPGATLHFVEHGLAPDEGVRRWQRRLEPLNKRMLGGCHLTREPARLIEQAGFRIDELDAFYEDGAPKFAGAESLGIATAP